MAGTGYNQWGLWGYVSDDGKTYNVRMDTAKATAGAFPAGSGTNDKWGKISRNNKPRGVWVGGVFPSNQEPVRAFIYATTVAQQKAMVTAGSVAITISGVALTLTVTGYEGEKRSLGQYGTGS